MHAPPSSLGLRIPAKPAPPRRVPHFASSSKPKLSECSRAPIALITSSRFCCSNFKSPQNIQRLSCFKHQDSHEGSQPESVEGRLAEDLVKHEHAQLNVGKKNWFQIF